MPCRSGDDEVRYIDVPIPEKYLVAEASLCAFLRAAERRGVLESILDSVDWSEAGVTRSELYGWLADHKRQDKRRSRRC